MTATCSIANCPFCNRESCRVCGAAGCNHDSVERHQGSAPLEQLAIARTGTPTTPLARALLAARIDVQFDGDEAAEDAAAFFERCAKIIRETGKLNVSVG